MVMVERDRLTPRERQVLQKIADGVPSRDLARDLGIALGTLRTYRERILLGLGARNITEAVAIALREGWIR